MHLDPHDLKRAFRRCIRRTSGMGTMSITMPDKLQAAVIRRAQAEDRSFSATVRRAVEQYLAANAS